MVFTKYIYSFTIFGHFFFFFSKENPNNINKNTRKNTQTYLIWISNEKFQSENLVYNTQLYPKGFNEKKRSSVIIMSNKLA